LFYEETEFQETPTGLIPRDWEIKRLGDVCNKITDGTHRTPKYVDSGIPFLSTRNIVPFRKGFDFSEYKKYITREEHEEFIKRCKPEKGDILISKCGTIGRTKLIDVDYEFSIFVGLALLKLKKDIVVGEYLEQLLNYKPYRLRMEVSSPGSTRKTLTINAIEKLQIPLPSLSEQRAIVGVLGVVDSAVELVDRVIAKTERLKKGLMQTLLTRGIGHKEYKQTPIGKTPKTWQVVRLKDVSFDFIGGGTPSTSNSEYWDGGIAWMTSAHINGRFITSGQRYITKKGLENSATNVIPKDNLLVATRVGIGKAAINKIDIAISQDLTGVIVDKDKALPDFLYWVIINNEKRLKSMAQGSTIKGILREDLGRLLIPKPPLDEQKEITEILSAVDTKFELEKKEKTKLEKIKRGLMDLLLTGKIRVKVD